MVEVEAVISADSERPSNLSSLLTGCGLPEEAVVGSGCRQEGNWRQARNRWVTRRRRRTNADEEGEMVWSKFHGGAIEPWMDLTWTFRDNDKQQEGWVRRAIQNL